MFWKIFEQLCRQRGASPTSVSLDMGFSNATAAKWKKGSTPQGATLQRIADYFDVSVDYLLGKDQKPTIRTLAHESTNDCPTPPPSDSDIMINVSLSVLTKKISHLDEIDRGKIEAYADGLLAAEKYQEHTHQIKMAARDGGVKEVALTDSQIEAIKNLPEVTDLD